MMKKTRALLLALGLAASAVVVSATPASASPCGLHAEAGPPTQLWWHNCDASSDLVEVHWLVLPTQTVCIPGYADEWVASQDYDNPVDFATDLKQVGENC
jgi:hypothetical protein